MADGHGDVVQLVDAAGTVTQDYLYDAFGNRAETAEEDTNPFRYAGEYFDAETGNIYLRARYYDTAMGRFTSEDPVRDGMNWYVYCDGDPVSRWDPSGTSYINGVWQDDVFYYMNDGSYYGYVVGEWWDGEYELIIVDKNGNVNQIDFRDVSHTITITESGRQLYMNPNTGEIYTLDGEDRITENNIEYVPDPAPSAAENVVEDDLPLTGEPNSSQTINQPDGTPKQTREYGPDGKATTDTDYTNHGNAKRHPKVPHKHDWVWTGPESSPQASRGPDYDMTPEQAYKLNLSVFQVFLGMFMPIPIG